MALELINSSAEIERRTLQIETVAVLSASVGAILLVFLWLVLRTRSAHGNQKLRFDGVYQSKRIGNYRGYVRFYPDGTVITVTSSGRHSDLRAWFTKKHDGVSVGKITLKGGDLSFSCASPFGTVDYHGEINSNNIHLRSYSHIND